MRLTALTLACCFSACGAQAWTVRVEEPTGLYRRTDEVVRVPLDRLGKNSDGFQVMDAAGRELPWQAGSGELLFPASLIPGELPGYRISCCNAAHGTQPVASSWAGR